MSRIEFDHPVLIDAEAAAAGQVSLRGNPAPEILRRHRHDLAADIDSLGQLVELMRSGCRLEPDESAAVLERLQAVARSLRREADCWSRIYKLLG